jgi:heptosyltransferase-2
MPQGIGDVIMTIPVIKKIAKEKTVIFSISIKSEIEATVIRELCPDINIVFINLQDIFNRSNTLIAFFTLVIRIRKLNPDIILTQFNVSAVKSSLTSFLAGVKMRVGWEGPFSFLNTLTLSPSGQHKTTENFKSLEILNINIKDVHIEYPQFKPEGIDSSNIQLDNLLKSNLTKIAISPGSQEFDRHKRWPKSKFSILINKIMANYSNIMVCLVGNEREKKLCEDIRQNVDQKDNVINLAGKTSIPELLYFLSQVHLTITNCNGISHLACAANSVIIGLYGPTNYDVTGPISKTFIPITAGLDCSPCYQRDYRFGCGDPICMEKIGIDEVYQSVKKVILNY